VKLRALLWKLREAGGSYGRYGDDASCPSRQPKAPIQDHIRPTPASGQVLVRIKASGVNPLDLKNRAGQAAHARHPLTAILGSDLAGVVETIGCDVSAFRQGDEGVCTENLNPETVVMKSTQDGKRPDHTGPLNRARNGRILVQGQVRPRLIIVASNKISGRVEDWRAGRPLDRATSPVPSTSHAACGFPALRAPICFTPRLMGPIRLGQLSVRRVALDSR
jgi:hypothetical protein